MRKHRHGSSARRGYHHGNLKEALVDAGRQLIVEKGPQGFSLVEAARIADVSPAAPYRHFANRDALLMEIARRGFLHFAEAVEKAWDAGQPDAITAFARMGEAYISFARQDRASYAAMFEAGLEASSDAELDKAAKRAFETLYWVAEAFNNGLPEDKRPGAEMISAHIWALAHGIATLFGVKGYATPTGHLDAQTLLREGMGIYLKGLGIAEVPKT